MPSNSSNFVEKVTVNKPASSFSTQIISFPIVGLGNKKLLLHNLKVQLWFTRYVVLLMSLLLLLDGTVYYSSESEVSEDSERHWVSPGTYPVRAVTITV